MPNLKPNLFSLYISPLDKCNLNCKVCYTQKTSNLLFQKQILDFVGRFRQQNTLETVTFCGGEVFLLDWFPNLINQLTEQGLLVELITNGTINRLDEIAKPNLVNLIISIDGVKVDHNLNRGKGNFDKSWKFLLKAIELGFHFEIFTVVTSHNFDHLDQFEVWLTEQLGELPTITYHPRKPLKYLENHPVDNLMEDEVKSDQFGFLSSKQMAQLSQTKKVFPPVNLGCHQLSVMSDGSVYGCCEGFTRLGIISDPIDSLIHNYSKNLQQPPACNKHCQGCVEPNFACGIMPNQSEQ